MCFILTDEPKNGSTGNSGGIYINVVVCTGMGGLEGVFVPFEVFLLFEVSVKTGVADALVVPVLSDLPLQKSSEQQ